jgi:hypothetical protein
MIQYDAYSFIHTYHSTGRGPLHPKINLGKDRTESLARLPCWRRYMYTLCIMPEATSNPKVCQMPRNRCRTATALAQTTDHEYTKKELVFFRLPTSKGD